MARKSKNKSTIEEINKMQELIQSKRNEILELEKIFSDLFLQKKEKDKEEIYQKMLRKNISVEHLLDIIDKTK